MMYFETFSVSSPSVATVSEIYLLNISPLRLNTILIYDTAITEWLFDIMGCDDCCQSENIEETNSICQTYRCDLEGWRCEWV